nr:hypothetical protein BgiMline_024918 [Biomphalaria glabrata]
MLVYLFPGLGPEKYTSGQFRSNTSLVKRSSTSGQFRSNISLAKRSSTSGQFRSNISLAKRSSTSGQFRSHTSLVKRSSTSGQFRSNTSLAKRSSHSFPWTSQWNGIYRIVINTRRLGLMRSSYAMTAFVSEPRACQHDRLCKEDDVPSSLLCSLERSWLLSHVHGPAISSFFRLSQRSEPLHRTPKSSPPPPHTTKRKCNAGSAPASSFRETSPTQRHSRITINFCSGRKSVVRALVRSFHYFLTLNSSLSPTTNVRLPSAASYYHLTLACMFTRHVQLVANICLMAEDAADGSKTKQQYVNVSLRKYTRYTIYIYCFSLIF